GATLYIGWGSDDLVVFHWINSVGASGLVVRPHVAMPSWMLHSLPDGCWVYALTSWMLIIWGRFVPWVFTGVVIALGSEFGQLIRVVPGTYDSNDVIAYVVAFLIA